MGSEKSYGDCASWSFTKIIARMRLVDLKYFVEIMMYSYTSCHASLYSTCLHSVEAVIILGQGQCSFCLIFLILLSNGIEPCGNRYNFEVVLFYIESKWWRQKLVETKEV